MNIVTRRRTPYRTDLDNESAVLPAARTLFRSGEYLAALDVVDQGVRAYPSAATRLLAAAYDEFYCTLPDQTRYGLYQARLFEFDIRPGDKVLDIGSGHSPFPLATVLADIALSDNQYGRAGAPFRHVDGKPVYEVSVEATGFADKEFDFIYCSHVLEHANDPEQAVRELMRVGRRGFVETPRPVKDYMLASAAISNHRWGVELEGDTLVFAEYTPDDLEGIGDDVVLEMCCDPRSEREKAFVALLYLYADRNNTMLMWDESLKVRVRSAG